MMYRLFFCCLVLGRSLQALTIHDYLVDQQTNQRLETHNCHLDQLVATIDYKDHKKHGVWHFDWLPGYYVKYNVQRLIKREELARCIEKYQLTLLHVPKKYLYHIKGQPYTFTNRNYVVLSTEVSQTLHEWPLTYKHVKHLITLIEQTGFCSTFAHNFIRRPDGRLSIIDTDGQFNKDNPIKGLIGLLYPELSSSYTKEARTLLCRSIARHLSTLESDEQTEQYNLIRRVLSYHNAHKTDRILRALYS